MPWKQNSRTRLPANSKISSDAPLIYGGFFDYDQKADQLSAVCRERPSLGNQPRFRIWLFFAQKKVITHLNLLGQIPRCLRRGSSLGKLASEEEKSYRLTWIPPPMINKSTASLSPRSTAAAYCSWLKYCSPIAVNWLRASKGVMPTVSLN